MSKNPRDKTDSQSDSFEGTRESTRVDLGDDLLERTATLVRDSTVPQRDETAAPETSHPESFDIEDQLHSSRILLAEGFADEAKRILRKILVIDPHHLVARQALEQIHELELKQLFSEEPRRRRLKRDEARDILLTEQDAEEIMRELDQDLKLGIFDDVVQLPKNETPALALFGDEKAIERYGARLDDELAGNSGQDRVDLGIAFLEMGLHELALRQFRAACHVLMQKQEENAEEILSATALTAYTLILIGRPYEATMLIQGILRDTEIEPDKKLEFLYLMGRAYETMRKPELARSWYEQVARIDPHYRDVGGRLARKR